MTAPRQHDHSESDRIAQAHILVAAAFMVGGGILYLLALLAMRFPIVFSPPFGYGRLRPIAMLAVMLGWLVMAGAGGVFYVLPRLTGTPLRMTAAARGFLWGLPLLTVAGMALVLAGVTDGVEPFGLPWWFDIPVVVILSLPLFVAVATTRNRTVDYPFVSLLFVLGGVAWLPLLYIAGNIPGLSSMATQLGASVFETGFASLWVFGTGLGLTIFAAVRRLDTPLAGGRLARVAFWSIAVGGTWAAAARFAFGPLPGWATAVAAALSITLPVAALAGAATLAFTVDRAWQGITGRPVALAAMAGAGFAIITTAAGSLAAFGSAASAVDLTLFWDGFGIAMLFGVGGLWFAAWVYHTLPAISGRAVYSNDLARRHVVLTVVGAGGAGLLFMLAGLTVGYGWLGGAWSGAFVPVGAGWADAVRGSSAAVILAIFASMIMVAGHLALAANVFGTVSSGRATSQEVLVDVA